MARAAGCPLCEAAGGVLVGATGRLRVIRADEPGFPAFYRVVWTDHVAEFSDLAPADRRHCMDAVVLVEEAVRRHAAPEKVNLAALGNMVAHLHWHVIARYLWDSRFPGAVWAPSQREAPDEALGAVLASLPALEQDIDAGLRQLA